MVLVLHGFLGGGGGGDGDVGDGVGDGEGGVGDDGSGVGEVMSDSECSELVVVGVVGCELVEF